MLLYYDESVSVFLVIKSEFSIFRYTAQNGDDFMYTLVTSLKQTLKLFAASVICSLLFVRFYDAAYTKPLMGFILLLASMLLFVFVCDKLFTTFFENSEGYIDYLIPSAISFVIYVVAAFVTYTLDFQFIGNLLFLPTLFITPLLPETTAYLLSYLIIFLIIIKIPVMQYYYERQNSEDGSSNTPFSRLIGCIAFFSRTISNIFKYTMLLFVVSILCSALFINILVSVQKKPLVFVFIISLSLLLFLFVCDRLFFQLCKKTQTALEYLIPSICAVALYIAAASALYSYSLSEIYNLIFLPTRFLEPMYQILEKSSIISLISYITSYVLLLAVIIRIPIERYFFMKELANDIPDAEEFLKLDDEQNK